MNTHEKNYTKGKLARRKAHVEDSITRYLAEIEAADSADTGPATPRIERLTERLTSLRGRLGELEAIGRQLETSADGQLSLTDPDARAMATGSDHRGVVGYNVQAAVDTKHHIVVANAVTNRGNDRSHLLEMAEAAKAATGSSGMIALADRGYYEGEQIRSCAAAGITPMVPRPNTSPAQARGFWGKPAFVDGKGAALKSITESIDTATTAGRVLYHVLGALAEFERETIRERVTAGMRAAKRAGIHTGRPAKMTAARVQEARTFLANGKSWNEVCRLFDISQSTLSRALTRFAV